jgi:hypothetical protein
MQQLDMPTAQESHVGCCRSWQLMHYSCCDSSSLTRSAAEAVAVAAGPSPVVGVCGCGDYHQLRVSSTKELLEVVINRNLQHQGCDLAMLGATLGAICGIYMYSCAAEFRQDVAWNIEMDMILLRTLGSDQQQCLKHSPHRLLAAHCIGKQASLVCLTAQLRC